MLILDFIEKANPHRIKILLLQFIRLLISEDLETVEQVRCKYCNKIIAEKNKVGESIIVCRHCRVKNNFDWDDHTTEYRDMK